MWQYFQELFLMGSVYRILAELGKIWPHLCRIWNIFMKIFHPTDFLAEYHRISGLVELVVKKTVFESTASGFENYHLAALLLVEQTGSPCLFNR